MIFNQSEFNLRCEWGLHGVEQLAPISDVIIIVDVFSFSTSVDIATSREAIIYPYRYWDDSARTFAHTVDAQLAGHNEAGFSLSPSTLVDIPNGTRLVLPSPNGSTLTLNTGSTVTLAGCLRNARAVARAARRYGDRISVIPAGEQWPDGSLRPAVEDWLGAGAILYHFAGDLSLSPESEAAVWSFKAAQPALISHLECCSSGKEKRARGRESDIALAGALDISVGVPVLQDGAYQLVEA